MTPTGKIEVSAILEIEPGTLWTTGQVGACAKTGIYHSSVWRTGFDNRSRGGLGSIRLVTTEITHWLSPGYNTHTVPVGLPGLQVLEWGAALLLAAGSGRSTG